MIAASARPEDAIWPIPFLTFSLVGGLLAFQRPRNLVGCPTGPDDDERIVLFVGRITDQKGIFHLLEAHRRLPRNVQTVLCASAPDTPEIEERPIGGLGIFLMRHMADEIRYRRKNGINHLTLRFLP